MNAQPLSRADWRLLLGVGLVGLVLWGGLLVLYLESTPAASPTAWLGLAVTVSPVWTMAVPLLLWLAPGSRGTGERDPVDVRSALEGMQRVAAGRLPTEAEVSLSQIYRQILDVLPRAGHLPPGSHASLVIQRIAIDYLPATLHAFLALPPTFAATRVVEGKTGVQLLLEQLDLIATSVEEIADAVHRRDLERLAANGCFLRERLGHRFHDGLRADSRWVRP